MAPYGILQSLLDENAADGDAEGCSARADARRHVRSRAGRGPAGLGGVLQQDHLSIAARSARQADRAGGVGEAGSQEPHHALRAGVRRGPRQECDAQEIQAGVPHLVGAADGAAARKGRTRGVGAAWRLPGRSLGSSRRRLDHPGPQGVKSPVRRFSSAGGHSSLRHTPYSFQEFPMSGHSKWHTIKHKKGAADAKRGKIFTRLIKELTVAARSGGGDPGMNPRLRTIIAAAKEVNMPADNIKKAIQRGTGELPGIIYEEITYEAYGPGGSALIIETMTDNKNRTVGELRHMLEKHAGNLGATNSVAWMFSKKGLIVVEKAKADEEKLLSIALEAGADDMADEGDNWEVLSEPSAFEAVRDAVKASGVEPASAQVAMLPQNYVKLTGAPANQMIRLMDALDDHEDVKQVWSNFDIEEKEIEASLA